VGEPAENLGPEARSCRRTNLLLTAAIEFNGLTAQVRIRNVSESGAMIEGTHLPASGSRLWLKRANLQVAATVAWAGSGKAGIHFDDRIRVDAWGGGKPRPIELSGLRDQRRVDALQHAIRAGLPIQASEEAPPSAANDPGQLNARIAEELNYVARLIESLGDQLAGDPAILHKHSGSLQTIDLANQILCHLAGVVAAEEPCAKVADIGMADLRARLTRNAIIQSLS